MPATSPTPPPTRNLTASSLVTARKLTSPIWITEMMVRVVTITRTSVITLSMMSIAFVCGLILILLARGITTTPVVPPTIEPRTRDTMKSMSMMKWSIAAIATISTTNVSTDMNAESRIDSKTVLTSSERPPSNRMMTSAAERNRSLKVSRSSIVWSVTRRNLLPRMSGPITIPRRMRIRTSGILYLLKNTLPKNPMNMMEPIATNAVMVSSSMFQHTSPGRLAARAPNSAQLDILCYWPRHHPEVRGSGVGRPSVYTRPEDSPTR